MQKNYCGLGRAQVDNSKEGMLHTARLGPDLAAGDMIGLCVSPPVWPMFVGRIIAMQKFYCGTDRAQVENSK